MFYNGEAQRHKSFAGCNEVVILSMVTLKDDDGMSYL